MAGRKRALVAALSLAAVLAPAQGAAQGAADAIAGFERDGRGQGFAYTGLIASRPASGRYGLVRKLFVGRLSYSFRSGGRELGGRQTMVLPAAGARLTEGDCTVTWSVGADLRESRVERLRRPPLRSRDAGVSFQVEAYRWGRGFSSVSFIASFSTVDGFLWARLRAGHGIGRLGGHIRLSGGWEAVIMGNDAFNAAQSGLVVELADTSTTLSVLVKAGLKSASVYDTWYWGLELYRRF